MNDVNVVELAVFVHVIPPGAVHHLAAVHVQVEEFFHCAVEIVLGCFLNEKVERDENVFGISRHINHLK